MVREFNWLKQIMNINDLEKRVSWVWRKTVEIHRNSPETRLASSLSPIEIFVALYYGGVLKYNPKSPLAEDRDRLIISKGHGSICMYPILADLGFFSKKELTRVCLSGGILGGIPDPIIPGYETVNGSLGHGLGVATGSALALRVKNAQQSIFVITGDGELHEGSCWEAIMFAGHHNLDNLTLIIDNNSISMLDYTDNIVSHEGFSHRLEAFGWYVETVEGHDVYKVHQHLSNLKALRSGKPKALIAKTLKGRGIPKLENHPLSHIINPTPDLLDNILGEKFD